MKYLCPNCHKTYDANGHHTRCPKCGIPYGPKTAKFPILLNPPQRRRRHG